MIWRKSRAGPRVRGPTSRLERTTAGRMLSLRGILSPSSTRLFDFVCRLGRSVSCHILVASQQELKDRIMAATDEFDQHPVILTSS